MYQWIENTIGIVPDGSEWIYSVGTLILYISFILMICSPIIIIVSIIKNRRKRTR